MLRRCKELLLKYKQFISSDSYAILYTEEFTWLISTQSGSLLAELAEVPKNLLTIFVRDR